MLVVILCVARIFFNELHHNFKHFFYLSLSVDLAKQTPRFQQGSAVVHLAN